MPKISVIVPVYNVEKYVDVCLDSILAQSFKDFEIICIDDGSTDSSGEIIERYSYFDNRIRVFHQENSGLAATRNVGLEYSLGKYVMFVDSDDWISPVMLGRLHKIISNTRSDYVFSGIFQYDSASCQIANWELMNKQTFNYFVKKPYFNEMEVPPGFMFNQHVMVWAKLYRKNFIEDFRFPEGKIFEDNPFFTRCYLKANRIGYDFAPLYYYRANRPNSIVSAQTAKYKDIFDIFKMVKDVFVECGKFDRYKTEFILYYMNIILYRTINTGDEYREEMFNLLKQTFGIIDFNEYNIEILDRSPIYNTIRSCFTLTYDQFNNNFVKRQVQNEK